MSSEKQAPQYPSTSSAQRFVGLDLHKHYLIAIGVDADLNEVLGPQRVSLVRLDSWAQRHLTQQDAVVLEMTTNTFQIHDELLPYAHSVTVVHPPHVALITRARVMTDKLAARILARLHAAGLLPPVWVPPQEVRDLRALLAQRRKLVRLSVQAKNRLHALLHRYHIPAPRGNPFAPRRFDWWLALPITPLERVCVQSDLDTLTFARTQADGLKEVLTSLAAHDDRVPLLVQLPGISIIAAMTLLAAIGEIARFPCANKLVGYAGLGACVHDSGQRTRRGRITKAGRRELRAIMVQAAHTAANSHPHWKAERARLEARIGRNKATVAIARKLLVAVWHVLSKGCADRYADPKRLARKLMRHTLRLGKANRPQGQTTAQYVREQLDRLGVGAELTEIPWGTKKKPIPLPPSRLKPAVEQPPATLEPVSSESTQRQS
jgi:transposase